MLRRWISVTEAFFQWLRWVVTVTIVRYAAVILDDFILRVITLVGFLLIAGYTMARVRNFTDSNLRWPSSTRGRWLVSLLFTLVVSSALILLAEHIVQQLTTIRIVSRPVIDPAN